MWLRKEQAMKSDPEGVRKIMEDVGKRLAHRAVGVASFSWLGLRVGVVGGGIAHLVTAMVSFSVIARA